MSKFDESKITEEMNSLSTIIKNHLITDKQKNLWNLIINKKEDTIRYTAPELLAENIHITHLLQGWAYFVDFNLLSREKIIIIDSQIRDFLKNKLKLIVK